MREGDRESDMRTEETKKRNTKMNRETHRVWRETLRGKRRERVGEDVLYTHR